MKIQNLWNGCAIAWLRLLVTRPNNGSAGEDQRGRGCWSQDRTTAWLGKTNEGGRSCWSQDRTKAGLGEDQRGRKFVLFLSNICPIKP